MNNLKIIIPCYNAEKYIRKCIESILCQTYKNFQIIVMNDASTDGTKDILDDIIENTVDGRIKVVHQKKNIKPLHNTIQGIQYISTSSNDIIVIVDGDDCLKDEFVLEKIDKAYKDGYHMTHGSYEQLSNGQKRINKFDMPFDRKNRTHAVYHLRTFRRLLFDNISPSDLMEEDGSYFSMTGDMALLFPMIEMLKPEHVKFFEEILYVYNELNPINEFKINLCNQERIENIIRNKPPYLKHEGLYRCE